MVLIPPFPNNVPTADIAFVDFDLLVAGDEEASRKVITAAQGYGFFYMRNTGIDSDFMFDLADEVFNLPLDEKMKFEVGSTGGYFGYKMSGSHFVDEKGTPDCSQFYNVAKDDILRVGRYREHPLRHLEPINQRRQQLEQFMLASHKVATQVLRTLGEQLGIGPDILPSLHQIDRTGGDQARVTHAPPIGSDTIAIGEHSDFGSVTVLFNRLGGLQVINPESHEWRYVKPQPGCAIINLGDAMVKFSGGRLVSGVHRVAGPPGEQARHPRHSVGYFARPNGDVKLRSLLGDAEDEADILTSDEWSERRTKMRNLAQYKDASTFSASRGTEHLRDRVQATMTTPAAMLPVV